MGRHPWSTNVTRETYMKWCAKMVKYYEEQIPFNKFDSRGLKRDMWRMMEMAFIYRILCSSAYLGVDIIAGGVVTRDILKDTGWKMPSKATASQILEDNEKSDKIEAKCRPYINWNELRKVIRAYDLQYPVEWRAYYCLFVPKTIFTPEEIFFMENNPQWLLFLLDDPTVEPE